MIDALSPGDEEQPKIFENHERLSPGIGERRPPLIGGADHEPDFSKIKTLPDYKCGQNRPVAQVPVFSLPRSFPSPVADDEKIKQQKQERQDRGYFLAKEAG